ncbi:MAG: hypothetical protein RMJ56_03740 [Gemmataceae bacterium]|nr:hypothetical protein [Gemmata sp.]MDW8196701.1 hypothetical protein [Gemmataceae bacterium]
MRTILFAVVILSLMGCTTFKPVGPLAPEMPITQQGQPLPAAAYPATAARPPAIKPTPPTLLVTPDDVEANNARAIAAKLANELEIDMKAAVNAPVTVEVSRPKVK